MKEIIHTIVYSEFASIINITLLTALCVHVHNLKISKWENKHKRNAHRRQIELMKGMLHIRKEYLKEKLN